MSEISQNQQFAGLRTLLAEAEDSDASCTWARAYGGPWRRLSFSSGPPSPTRLGGLLAAAGGVADGNHIGATAAADLPLGLAALGL